MIKLISVLAFLLVHQLAFSQLLTSTLFKSKSSNESIIGNVISEHNTPITDYKLFRKPTDAEKIKRIFTEWDKLDYLAVAIPKYTLDDSELRNTEFQIIENAARFTKVLILMDEDDIDCQSKFLFYTKDSYIKQCIAEKRVVIMPCNINSIWVRDYGPTFGLNKHDNICIIDAMYTDVHSSSKSKIKANTTADEDPENDGRNQKHTTSNSDYRISDDEVPTSFAVEFGKNNEDLILVRPPIQVWGGDIQFDSKRNLFTSTNTLLMNGGNKQLFDQLTKDYYGAKSVTYLEPLFGPTIKHIDMFFKVVDDSTVLLGKYQMPELSVKGNTANFIKRLVEVCNERLQSDSCIIAEKFPYMKVVRMPMPPIENEGLFFRIEEIFKKYYNQSTENDTLDWQFEDDKLNSSTDTAFRDAYRELYKVFNDEKDVKSPYDSLSKNDMTKLSNDLISLLRQYTEDYSSDYGFYSSKDLATLKKLYDNNHPETNNYTYLTFLNSVFLNGENGRILLVPSFTKYEYMNNNIKEIYEKAYPNTIIKFINCDKLITLMGAIHCISLQIPKLY